MPGQNSIPSRMQLDTVGGIAKAVYDFADVGGREGNIPLELELPAGSIIYRAYLDVQTPLTGGTNDTLGLSFIGAATVVLLTGATLSSVGVNTTGVKQVPIVNGTGVVTTDLANLGSPIKLASKSVLNLVVGTADLTAGKFVVYLQYFGV